MPTKYKQSDPQATVGAVEMKCHGRRIALTPTVDDSSATFCDPFGSLWTFSVDVFQSFGTGGLETDLRPLVNTIVQVVYEVEDGATVSADKPNYRFDWRVPPFPVVDAGIREFSPFTISGEIEEGTLEKTVDGTTWAAI